MRPIMFSEKKKNETKREIIIIISIPMKWVSMNNVVCLVRRTSDSYQYMWEKNGFYRSPLFYLLANTSFVLPFVMR